MFLNEFLRDRADSEPDQKREDDQIIQMPDDRDKVGDEIHRRKGISHRAAKQPPRRLWTSRIGGDRPPDLNLPANALRCACKFLFHSGKSLDKQVADVDPLGNGIIRQASDLAIQFLPAGIIPHQLERVPPEVEVAIDRLDRVEFLPKIG